MKDNPFQVGYESLWRNTTVAVTCNRERGSRDGIGFDADYWISIHARAGLGWILFFYEHSADWLEKQSLNVRKLIDDCRVLLQYLLAQALRNGAERSPTDVVLLTLQLTARVD